MTDRQTKKLVTITQPDLFPWLGAFDKFIKCDAFVFLDHVTNRPSSGIWTKRVKILMNGAASWLTIPLKKAEVEFVPINEMIIDIESHFSKKHLATLRSSYGKAPFFGEVSELIENFYSSQTAKIAERNITFIIELMRKLNIQREVYFSSELGVKSKKNELLIDIVKQLEGDRYLYGSGSISYLDFDLWKNHKIDLIAQDFIHPEYSQLGSDAFIPGLSIIDLLSNVGFEGMKKLLTH